MPVDSVRPQSAPIPTAPPELLRCFMEAYWLRPENAFWMALRSLALSTHEIRSPSIDISCGDGIFTFLHNGGRLSPDFDVFAATGKLDRVTNHHADMFDVRATNYQPNIIQRPVQLISVGTDLKPYLLEKASQLELYQDLVEHDSNQPMPFASGTFRTVYCNSAYWVKEIDHFIAELSRIVSDSGFVVIHAKLDSIKQFTLDAYESKLGRRFLDIIGRGRFETWPSLMSRSEWEKKFDTAGLEIVDAIPFVTGTHAHIWDLGLRPIAPLLVRMANSITAETRRDVKRDWVNLWCDLLEPICDPHFSLGSSPASEPVEIQYVLRRR